MMRELSSVQAPAGNHRSTASAAAKANMDYDSFLKLFMAQMRNQDPTKPNDPTETLSQLATFSNVEQSIKLNEKLDSLLVATNANIAAGLVGKSVSSLDGTVSGVVSSVQLSAEGLIATLKDGKKLNLGQGYSVGSP